MIGLMMMLAALPAQEQQSKAEQAAQSFSLDLSAPPEDTPPAPAKDPATLEEQVAPPVEAGADAAPSGPSTESPVEAPAAPADKADPPTVTVDPAALAGTEIITIPVTLSLDTPIKDLVADKRGRAVLDADMPGLSTDENLPKFADRSLREFQPLTGGQLTDALLAKLEADLADPSKVMAAVEAKRKKEAAMGR